MVRVHLYTCQKLLFYYQTKGVDEFPEDLLKIITKYLMVPFYISACSQLGLEKDEELIKKLLKKQEEKADKIRDKIKYAEKNYGDSEVTDAKHKLIKLYIAATEGEKAQEVEKEVNLEKMATKLRFDVAIYHASIALCTLNLSSLKHFISKAELLKEHIDYQRKNKLSLFRGLFALITRDFSTAATTFLECLPTFDSDDVITHKELVMYAVISSLVGLDRKELISKCAKCSDVLAILPRIPLLETILNGIVECKYDGILGNLVNLSDSVMKWDPLLVTHRFYFFDHVRSRAFSQFLFAFRTVRIEVMAGVFTITEDMLVRELMRLIVCGRLAARINETSGCIETIRMLKKGMLTQELMEKASELTEKVERLAKAVVLEW
ncbi:putative multi-domain containing protein [Aduncisulcus paluster]|uniref:Multi-domain containing protein n=1 Tax=Aduncisulcus paluster TaxID=2918883 RepID=A0ABQ5KJY6_9EUKA|nr:putative multi-domain containing protein [Aduncisulcus paluster]